VVVSGGATGAPECRCNHDEAWHGEAVSET
jgi:hypothetical protein